MYWSDLYQALRTTPLPVTEQEEEPARFALWTRLADLLGSPQQVPHPPVQALVAFVGEVVKQGIIPLATERFGLSSVSFVLWRQPGGESALCPMIVLPMSYVAQVRDDPMVQCGLFVFAASYVRDYLCQRLSVHPSRSRACAFEAEFLLWLRTCHQQEGLPWTLNAYQQGVLSAFPLGLASLPSDLIYPTPDLYILRELPHREEEAR